MDQFLRKPFWLFHCFRQVLRATSYIGTVVLYVVSSRSSCLYSSMRRHPQEYITYELVPTPAVSRMSGSSNFYSFPDGWLVSVQVLLCGVLPEGLVQYCLLHSCVVAVKFFFFIRLVSVHVEHPYSSIDMTAAWKKLRFILSVKSDFHMTDSLSINVHAFSSRVVMSVSVNETLLPW